MMRGALPRPASFAVQPPGAELRARRLKWAAKLLNILLPQDLSGEDRITILCLMARREVAQLPEAEGGDALAFITVAVAHAAAGVRNAEADRVLCTHHQVGRA